MEININKAVKKSFTNFTVFKNNIYVVKNLIKFSKAILLTSAIFLTNVVHAQTYKATVFVENAGQTIGSWSGVATPQTVVRNKPAQIISLVNAKSITNGSYNYNLGFDIKMTLIKINGKNQLMLASSYSSLSEISPYARKIDNDESTITLGKVFKTEYNSNPNQAPMVLNTILFTNVLDVTEPRGIIIPIGRFIADSNGNGSLVNLKLKVENVK